MRNAMLLLAVLGITGSLWAADPIIGTWKLNIAKSRFASALGATPKQQTNTVRELAADQIEIAVIGSRTDGSAISEKCTAPKQGGSLKYQQPLPAEGESVILTVINPGDWLFTVLQNGKQVTTVRVVVSNDSKTAIETTKGTDAKGKPFEQLQVFDRQ